MNAQKAEKNEELRLKKIASAIAKEVKNFWANIEKVSSTCFGNRPLHF